MNYPNLGIWTKVGSYGRYWKGEKRSRVEEASITSALNALHQLKQLHLMKDVTPK